MPLFLYITYRIDVASCQILKAIHVLPWYLIIIQRMEEEGKSEEKAETEEKEKEGKEGKVEKGKKKEIGIRRRNTKK